MQRDRNKSIESIKCEIEKVGDEGRAKKKKILKHDEPYSTVNKKHQQKLSIATMKKSIKTITRRRYTK